MNDYLELFEKFKDDKEIVDLIDDVRKLRYYYSTQQYNVMLQHINDLTRKYAVETFVWNSTSDSFPTNYDQAYQNAEAFLRLKGLIALMKKGYKLSQYLRQEEINYIEQLIKSMEN